MGRAPIKLLPSQQELRELFDYDPETGSFTWKTVPARAYHAKVGQGAGTVTKRGYLQVGYKRRLYLVHRVIWKWVTGEEPAFQIDHEDTDRMNNRWDNFRPATGGQNRFNSKRPITNTSGVKGVTWNVRHKSWCAQIGYRGKNIHLGRFKSIEEAARVRCEAAEKLHGEFMRVA